VQQRLVEVDAVCNSRSGRRFDSRQARSPTTISSTDGGPARSSITPIVHRQAHEAVVDEGERRRQREAGRAVTSKKVTPSV
jgi:hypothetical protein